MVLVGVSLTLNVRQLPLNNHLHAALRRQIAGGKFGELSYVIEANGMKLVSITGSPALIAKLDSLDWREPAMQLLSDYAIDVSSPAPLSLAGTLS